MKTMLHKHVLATLAAAAAIAYVTSAHSDSKRTAMNTIPSGFRAFTVNEPPPACAKWRERMPKTRDPEAYRIYISARALWRSKVPWSHSRQSLQEVLDAVKVAAARGDWGAKALLAYFYLHGLGPFDSNRVLAPQPEKAIEITREAIQAGQPWGFYDLGVAYENGYGGVPQNSTVAWAYYLKAAELGSPEAQMTLADAYAEVKNFVAANTLRLCAYKQGHGPAAHTLGILAKLEGKFGVALLRYQDGVRFGHELSAVSLYRLFDPGIWNLKKESDQVILKQMGILPDPERSRRYEEISSALQQNPDLRFERIDKAIPLPPAKLPVWHGVDDALDPANESHEIGY